MVRPTSEVWNHFIKESHDDKCVAICKYCKTKYGSLNATRLAKHIEKCLKHPLETSFTVEEDDTGHSKTVYDISITSASDSVQSTSTSDYDVVTAVASAPSVDELSSLHSAPKRTKRNSQSVHSTFTDTMTNSETEKIDLAFVRAVYSSNCPLSLTDNIYWKKFFHQLCPSYKVPSEYDLTNRLLDKEYATMKEINMDKISKAQFLTVVTDGWSNIRNESMISFVVCTPSPIFYKLIETKYEKRTGQYISEELTKVVDEIGGHKVIALVSDNTSNMEAAWRILEIKYPDLNTIGCSSYGLNLLLGDIAKIGTFQLLISKSKEIIKYFKSKHTLLSVFTEKQKQKWGVAASTLKLCGETRWDSTFTMFKSLVNCKESLQEAVLEENVDQDVRQTVLDDDIFWASIESLSTVLKPICDGIAIIESDCAVLSDVPHAFQNIKNLKSFLKSTPLQIDEEERVNFAVEERQKLCCQPIHLAAYVLDPRYQENNLNSQEYRIAVDFISNFPAMVSTEEVLANFSQFQAREGIYCNDAIWSSAQHIGPLVWWKGLLANQSLSHVATQLFSIPPSAAACKRIFSAYSKTHTALKNKLSNDRISKLIAVRSDLILQNKRNEEKDISSDSDSDE